MMPLSPRLRPAAFLVLAASLAAPAALRAEAPPDLEAARFSGPEFTPSPACLCAAPTGEVFVGVDELGSLGKGPGKGRIVRLVDADGDGKPEKHTVFARIDNPRGLIPAGTCQSSWQSRRNRHSPGRMRQAYRALSECS